MNVLACRMDGVETEGKAVVMALAVSEMEGTVGSGGACGGGWGWVCPVHEGLVDEERAARVEKRRRRETSNRLLCGHPTHAHANQAAPQGHLEDKLEIINVPVL
jgi:hypothetical protein